MLEWDHLRTRTKLQKAGVEEIGVFGKRSSLGRREFLLPNDADTFLLSFFFNTSSTARPENLLSIDLLYRRKRRRRRRRRKRRRSGDEGKLRYRSAPPGSSVLLLVDLTYPSNYHKHHLSIQKMAFLLALPTYLLTYMCLLSNTTLNRSRYTSA